MGYETQSECISDTIRKDRASGLFCSYMGPPIETQEAGILTVAAVKNVTDNISHTIDETMEAKANEDAKQQAIKEENKK
ncbi:MAG: hypothetical protein UDQ48_02790 [Dialister sp.]|uniref:hypothetical protein n=1 Tax=Dialister sp. TaxID=1955814 RepID=UPI002E79BBA5|nr:hypothetical protein [Dialister sp.]MEE0291514.1 hypothetical protein [Dialister sp.]